MSFRKLHYKISNKLDDLQSSLSIEESFFVFEERRDLSNFLRDFYKLSSDKKTLSLENLRYKKLIAEIEDEIYFWIKEADEFLKENIKGI